MKKVLLAATLAVCCLAGAQTHRYPHIDVVNSSPLGGACAPGSSLEQYSGDLYTCDPNALMWRILPGVDLRPRAEQTTGKTGQLAAGGSTQVFSVSGVGTITHIHMTLGVGATDAANLVQNSTINIACDGGLQVIPWGLFFFTQDAPTPFLTNTISVAEQPASFTSEQATYNRRVEINYRSSCTITLVNASSTGASNIYVDVSYRVGPSPGPLSRAYWNAYVTNLPNALFPSTTFNAGGGGELESVTQYLTSGTDYTYLEASPIVTADGATAAVANGGEDFNGSGFYYDFGANSLHSNEWGWSIGAGLQAKAAAFDSLAYRFFSANASDNLRFNSSLGIGWTWTPQYGPIPTGKALVTYWTALPVAQSPSFSPPAGQYSSNQTVTLSTGTGGAHICYTLDNSTPAANIPGVCSAGSTYSSPVSVTLGTTVKSLATLSGYNNSLISSATYNPFQSFSIVGHNTVQCGNPSSSCALPALTPGAGHELILCGAETDSTFTMTLSGMGSNTVVSPSGQASGSDGINCWVVLSAVNASITPQISISPSSVSFTQIFYIETSSTLPASIDTAVASNYSGAAVTTMSTGSLTSAGANELFFALFQNQGGGQPTTLSGGSPNAWVMSDNVGPHFFTAFYQLNAAQVSNQTYSMTVTSSTWTGTQVIALK